MLGRMLPPTLLPRTFVVSSAYISLARCAADYRAMLADFGCLAASIDEAEVVVLHVPLGDLDPLLAALPSLADKIVVGYLVWETDRLPAAALPALRHLDAIWTPSWYSARSFCAQHPCVGWLPHVIGPPAPMDAEERAEMANLLRLDGSCTLLQIIATAHDPRKGAANTEAAFAQAQLRRPGLRLISKTLPRRGSAEAESGKLLVRHTGSIVTLSGHLSGPQMAALYGCCHWLVNGAHGEGWGLTLSDAMAAGVPTIAADYSGPQAFLRAQGHLLVPTQEEPVRPEHTNYNFAPPMRWGYMLPNQFANAMVRAHDLTSSRDYEAMSASGRRDARAYDRRHVQVLLRRLLRALPRARPKM